METPGRCLGDTMSGEHDIIVSTKEKLNDVSKSFCLAKWLQVTIHLDKGHTHSCHHPSIHKIPLREVEHDPGALHNTIYKQKQQAMMIEGIRPPECQYCWNVEDLPGDHYSDRYLKSADSQWAGEHMIQEVVERVKAGEKIKPRYMEVSFSNACNFKCGYCSPLFSSKWASEVENHGPYILATHDYADVKYMKSSGSYPIHHKEYNPYVEAFWKWWPELVNELKVFRITGGEPFLDDNTFKIMDELLKTPNPEMELSFNSNLGVPWSIIDKYIKKINLLLDNNCIRRSVLYTSVDAHGAQAEYGRHGLDYAVWLENVDNILTKVPDLKMTIMCTTNILSITSFKKLLEDVLALKKKHTNKHRNMPLTIDMSILRWPIHYCVSILPSKYADLMDDSLKFMIDNQENANGNAPYDGFFIFEIEKMKRFIETIRQPINQEHTTLESTKAQQDFKLFVDEHDKRRGSYFLKTFPELEEFYRDCEKLHNNANP